MLNADAHIYSYFKKTFKKVQREERKREIELQINNSDIANETITNIRNCGTYLTN